VNIDQPRRRRKFIANDWEGRQYPASQEAALTLLQAQAQVLRAMPADEFPARFRYFAEWIMGIGEQILLPENIREGLVFAARNREGARDLLLEVGLKPQAPMMNGHHPEVEPPSAPTTTKGKAQVAQPSLERFRAFFAGEGSSEKPPMLVKGLLRENGVVIIGGQSQAGKSYVAVDLALSLATGADFFGKAVNKTVGVVYAAPEGDDTIQPRILAAKKQRGMADDEWPPIMILPEFRLPRRAERDDPFPKFIEDLRKAREAFAERGLAQPAVLFIDTASAGIDMESEKDNDSVAEVIERLKMLGRDLNMVVIVVHHFGKDPGRRLRGGSAWMANSDQTFSVYSKLDGNGIPINPRSLFIDKLRGVRAGLVSNFNVTTIKIGTDADGDVEEAFVEMTDGDAVTVAEMTGEAAKKKRKPRDHAFDQAFSWAIASHTPRRVQGDGPIMKMVLVSRVREQFSKSYGVGEDGQQRRDGAIRQAFSKALETVRKDRRYRFDVVSDTEWVYRTDQSDFTTVVIAENDADIDIPH
jgi:hypothetical protein